MKGSVLLAITALVAVAACGSSTSTVVSPGSTRCAVSVGGSATIPAGGGTGAVRVTTERECQWTASSDAPWLTITSTPSGQGEGTVQYSAAGNPAPAMRRGNIAVGEARVELMQAAAPCLFSVTPSSFTVDAAGGERSVTIQTLEGCAWTAASGVDWIAIVGTQNLNGPGSVTFRVDANSGEPRTASVVAAGQTIQVSQGSAAAPCTYALDPASATVEASGGTARFSVAARSGCGWTAASQVPWIQVSGDPVGSGNGTVTLVVAPNTGAGRSGTVVVQSQSFTVVQAAAATPCSYAIAPPGVTIGADGGPSNVTVTTQAGCTWTATSQVPWIVVGNSAGSGNGSVALTIAANTGAARSGTVSIAGLTFSVNQAASAPACVYSIAPESFAAPAAPSATGVDVTTQSGCAWTAVSQAEWIAITAGAAGTGNGRVELAIAANTSGARSATVTIAGRIFTVNQAALAVPCTYAIAPTSFTAPQDGGTTFADVTTQIGCAWTAVSNNPWIAVTEGATGSGNGRVHLTIMGNAGAVRNGSVTIAGQTFTVHQPAAPKPCTYAIAPTAFSAPAAGGVTEVTVTTEATCAWTAASQVPWIAIRSGGSGTGSGRVEMEIAPNVGAARTGTVAIAGQVFTVTQSAVGSAVVSRAEAEAGQGSVRLLAAARTADKASPPASPRGTSLSLRRPTPPAE